MWKMLSLYASDTFDSDNGIPKVVGQLSGIEPRHINIHLRDSENQSLLFPSMSAVSIQGHRIHELLDEVPSGVGRSEPVDSRRKKDK